MKGIKLDKFDMEVDSLEKVPAKEKEFEKYMVFCLNDDRYGISLSSVKEVIGIQEITPVPEMPNYFTGILNLRGRIISIVDLRKKLSVKVSDYQEKKTSIIITDLFRGSVGLIVDDIIEVRKIYNEDLDREKEQNNNFFDGVAKDSGNDLILILNIQKLFKSDDIKKMKI